MLRSFVSCFAAALICTTALAAQAGSLADVEPGMTEDQVREILGEPDEAYGYPTWKRFVPIFRRWAKDKKRVTWAYEGRGKVIFSYNQYIHAYKVSEVVADGGDGGGS